MKRIKAVHVHEHVHVYVDVNLNDHRPFIEAALPTSTYFPI